MLTPEQIKLRRSGIGSSDVGAVVSENPFKTIHDVWMDKVGLAEEIQGESDAAWLGHQMEPIIAGRYAVDRDVDVRRCDTTIVHPEHPWAMATPDFFNSPNVTRIIECKWVGQRTAIHWTPEPDGIPSYVYAQCIWQMFVTGHRKLDVAVIFGGTAEFRIYQVEYSERAAKAIFDACDHFWHHNVLGKVPPPPDGSEAARKVLNLVYKDTRVPLIPAPPEASEVFAERMRAIAAHKKAEREKEAATQRLIEILGKAGAEGMAGDFGFVTYKQNAKGIRSINCKERKEL